MANDMEIYAKFSARGYENPKLMSLALKHATAYRVWTWAIMYAVRNLTDGFIPRIVAETTLAARKKDLEILESSGFFEPVDDGWMIHDFLEAQGRSRADVEDARARKAENARKAAEARWSKPPVEDAQADADAMQPACDPQCDSHATRMHDACDPQCDGDAERCPDTDTDTDTSNILSPPTPSRPDFDELTSRLEAVWPTNRFDGRTGGTRMQLEIDWPKITRAAGDTDPAAFLLAKAKAYVDATDAKFVKTFSRFLGGELYMRNWVREEKPAAPPGGVQPLKTRSQQNLEANLARTWAYMTPDERARYGGQVGRELVAG